MQGALFGLFGSIALAIFAFTRSRAPGGYYDTTVYAMTPQTHRRYAAISLALAGCFALLVRFSWSTVEFAAFAALVLVAIFYLTSFLRGASETDD